MAKRSSLTNNLNDWISSKSNHNKGGKLWTQSEYFGKINFRIKTIVFEAKRLMRYECMWVGWIILVSSFRLPYIQEENSYVSVC